MVAEYYHAISPMKRHHGDLNFRGGVSEF